MLTRAPTAKLVGDNYGCREKLSAQDGAKIGVRFLGTALKHPSIFNLLDEQSTAHFTPKSNSFLFKFPILLKMAPRQNEKGLFQAAYEQVTSPEHTTIVRSILVFGVRPSPLRCHRFIFASRNY